MIKTLFKHLEKSSPNEKKTDQKKQIANLVENTRFTENQILEMKNRFSKVSKKQNKLNKEEFRQHMGLLGIDSALFLSDRIFYMLDNNNDNTVDFEEFMKYLDVLLNGNEKEKNEWTFKLIDLEKKGYITYENFSSLFESLVHVWVSMTGNQITSDILKHLDVYIKEIFKKMDIRKIQKVDINDFNQVVSKEPNLLEVFDVLNKGLTHSIDKDRKTIKQKLISNHLIQIISQIDFLLMDLQGHNISLKKMKTNENTSNSPEMKTIKSNSTLHIKKLTEKDKVIGGTPFSSRLFFSSSKQINDSGFAPTISSYKTPILFNQEEEEFILHDELLNENTHLPSSKMSSSLLKKPFRRQKSKVASSVILESPKNKFRGPAKNASETTMRKLKRSLTPNQFIEKKIEEEDSNEIESRENENNYNNKFPNENSVIIDNFQIKTIKIIKKLKEIKELAQAAQYSLDEFEKTSTTRAEHGVNGEERRDIIEEFRNKKDEMVYKKMKTITAQKIPRKNGKLKTRVEKNPKDKSSMVFLGHHNWNLVLNMMIGIQTAVKSFFITPGEKITNDDFSLSYFFEIIPRKYQNSTANFKTCRFFDYAPHVFMKLREINGVQNEDYLRSIGPERVLTNLIKGNVNTLSELVSTGKSGSFFYYSADGKYTLKTIHKNEYYFLQKILKNYYEHMSKNKKSFINKIYGLHKIIYKMRDEFKEKTIYFIIMENILNTNRIIHEKYDIKGSLYKRKTMDIDASIAKKDLNAIESNFQLKISPEIAEKFKEQLESDAHFFSQNNIIDYSMLFGIHRKGARVNIDKRSSMSSYLLSSYNTFSNANALDHFNRKIESTDGECIYFLGIIDILTNFNVKKKCESMLKQCLFGPSISAIPPKKYAERFISFISKMINTESKNEENAE